MNENDRKAVIKFLEDQWTVINDITLIHERIGGRTDISITSILNFLKTTIKSLEAERRLEQHEREGI